VNKPPGVAGSPNASIVLARNVVAQAEIVPSSVPKIKAAAMPLGFVVERVSGTTDVDVGFT
jgi:hypothetical protein